MLLRSNRARGHHHALPVTLRCRRQLFNSIMARMKRATPAVRKVVDGDQAGEQNAEHEDGGAESPGDTALPVVSLHTVWSLAEARQRIIDAEPLQLQT